MVDFLESPVSLGHGRKKRSNPHHTCPTKKSTFLSSIKRKPSSTARLEATTKTSALHQLPRHQQTTIFRLRTGHCRLNNHLKRIGVKTSAQCCGEADQTPEHFLQSCSLYHQARQQIWPTYVSLKTKLWGSAGGFVPDIQVCGTHGREDLVTATITSNAEEEELGHGLNHGLAHCR